MRYLVTGGCGFIGSHLVDELIRLGHTITVIDNFTVKHCRKLPQDIEVIKGNASDIELLTNVLENVDGCFHLAAVASVPKSTEYLFESHISNQSSTLALLDVIKRSGTTKTLPIVFASSAAVYGINEHLPLSEKLAPTPNSAYAADKLGSEMHGKIFSENSGQPFTALRFFNVYGEGQDPHSPYSGVISIFIDRILKKEPIEIFGDGEQVRDFVHVSDIVKAVITAMEHSRSGFECFNVCTGIPVSLNSLVQILFKIVGYEVPIKYMPNRIGDLKKSIGDPTSFNRKHSFDCEVGLEDGLRDFINGRI